MYTDAGRAGGDPEAPRGVAGPGAAGPRPSPPPHPRHPHVTAPHPTRTRAEPGFPPWITSRNGAREGKRRFLLRPPAPLSLQAQVEPDPEYRMSHRYDRRRGHAGWSPPLPMARTGPSQRPAGRSRGWSRGDEVHPLRLLLARTPQHLAPGLRPTPPPAPRPRSCDSPAAAGACRPAIRLVTCLVGVSGPPLDEPQTHLGQPSAGSWDTASNPKAEPQPHARTPTSRPSPNITPEPQHHARTPTPCLSPRPHDSSDCKAYSAFFCSANISKNYSRNKF